MTRTDFSVTYKIVTPESAEYGEADEQGFISESCNLREALDLVLQTRTAHCDCATMIEANEYPVISPRWVTVYNGQEFLTDARELRSLHFPDHTTPASRRRIARLLGCYGV